MKSSVTTQICIQSPLKESGSSKTQRSAFQIIEPDLWDEIGSPFRLHELQIIRSGKIENPSICSRSQQESCLTSGGVCLSCHSSVPCSILIFVSSLVTLCSCGYSSPTRLSNLKILIKSYSFLYPLDMLYAILWSIVGLQ